MPWRRSACGRSTCRPRPSACGAPFRTRGGPDRRPGGRSVRPTLDDGGMSGFDNNKVDAEFFPDGRVNSNFLCNLGHGDPSKVLARLPRLDFDEACTLM